MHKKNIKIQIITQLKKQLIKQIKQEVLRCYNFQKEIETPIDELLGIKNIDFIHYL